LFMQLADFVGVQPVFQLVGDFHEQLHVSEGVQPGSPLRTGGEDQFSLFVIPDLPVRQTRQLADGPDRDDFLVSVRHERLTSFASFLPHGSDSRFGYQGSNRIFVILSYTTTRVLPTERPNTLFFRANKI